MRDKNCKPRRQTEKEELDQWLGNSDFTERPRFTLETFFDPSKPRWTSTIPSWGISMSQRDLPVVLNRWASSWKNVCNLGYTNKVIELWPADHRCSFNTAECKLEIRLVPSERENAADDKFRSEANARGRVWGVKPLIKITRVRYLSQSEFSRYLWANSSFMIHVGFSYRCHGLVVKPAGHFTRDETTPTRATRVNLSSVDSLENELSHREACFAYSNFKIEELVPRDILAKDDGS